MLELKDLRAKITAESDAVLEAVSRATGRDRAEIVRDVLHVWAQEKIDESMMVHKMLRAQGLPGIAEGIPRDSQGIAGIRGE
jgi:hypothetical protein